MRRKTDTRVAAGEVAVGLASEHFAVFVYDQTFSEELLRGVRTLYLFRRRYGGLWRELPAQFRRTFPRRNPEQISALVYFARLRKLGLLRILNMEMMIETTHRSSS